MVNYTSDLNACLVNCSNKGDCALTNGTFACKCFPGYDGKFYLLAFVKNIFCFFFTWNLKKGTQCEFNLDPCSYFPCLNNGFCKSIVYPNNSATFVCNCGSSYYGSFCENKVDLCMNITCSNHGICKTNETINAPYCKCFPYYSGDNCEIITATLITIKKVVTSSTIIAVNIIGGLYLFFVALDVSNLIQVFVDGQSVLEKLAGMSSKPKTTVPVKNKVGFKPCVIQ